MDGELVESDPSAPHSFEEAFYACFPYYLSVGMTEGQFWDGDPLLPKYFRRADDLRRQRQNEGAWLQGMYIYDAISRLSPLIRPMGKKGTKPKPYVEEPYPIDQEKVKELEKKKEKATAEKGHRFMQALMVSSNRKQNGEE